MPKRNLIRRSEYRDSVQLMLAAGRLQRRPDIVQAILMMGTPSNKEFLRNQTLLSPEGEAATANDLIIALEANTAETLDQVERDMTSRRCRHHGKFFYAIGRDGRRHDIPPRSAPSARQIKRSG